MASWKWPGGLWLGVLAMGGVCANAFSGEEKKLEGTWLVISATQDGKASAELRDARMTVAGKELIFKSKEGKKQELPFEQKLPFRVDPSKKPSEIDLTLLLAGGWFSSNVDIRGIYELDGDTLTLCFGDQDKRPREFSDKGQALIVLRRQR